MRTHLLELSLNWRRHFRLEHSIQSSLLPESEASTRRTTRDSFRLWESLSIKANYNLHEEPQIQLPESTFSCNNQLISSKFGQFFYSDSEQRVSSAAVANSCSVARFSFLVYRFWRKTTTASGKLEGWFLMLKAEYK